MDTNIDKHTAAHMLIEQCKIGDCTNLKALALRAHDSGINHKALRWAVKGGHIQAVQELISFYDPKHAHNIVLRAAIVSNQYDIVQVLIKAHPPVIEEQLFHAVIEASDHMVTLLLPYATQQALDFGLQICAMTNKVTTAQYLLEKTNPKNDQSNALVMALIEKHNDMIELLYPISDLNQVHQRLKDKATISLLYQDVLDMFEQRMKAQQEHEALSAATHNRQKSNVDQRVKKI